jgi:nitroreductase
VKPPAFLELCRLRYSLRRFSDRPVGHEQLNYCLEAARLAPSADNQQPSRFIVFDDPAAKERLADAVFGGVFAPSRRFAAAPVLVALLLKENLLVNRVGAAAQGTQFQLIDAGIAGEHFCLAAAEQGLGACWIGWYDGRALIRHLKLRGKGYKPVALIAVGHPADDGHRPEKKRKPLDHIAAWNRPPA